MKTVAPKIAPFEIAEKAVNSGDSVSAVCNVYQGDSPLEIIWALNETPIEKDSPQITINANKKNSLLTIDPVNPEHAGTYTCIVSNKAGATSYSSKLIVNGTYRTCDFVTPFYG